MKTKFCTACNIEREVVKTAHEESKVEHELSCGHKYVEVFLEDSIKAYGLLGVKKMGKEPFSKKHKWEHEQVVGERIGKDGKPAFVHQVIDRVKDYYKKLVKQEDEIIKDVEGKLTNHKGHNEPK